MGIALESVDSRGELLERLRRTSKHVLLGDDDESPREYFIARPAGCVIGICSQGHGLRPSGLIDEAGQTAWIGYNSKVARVDLRSCRINFAVELDSVFFEFLAQMDDGSVIAIHELGAIRISTLGEVVWSCSTDIVTEFTDDGQVVSLRTQAGQITIEKERGLRQ